MCGICGFSGSPNRQLLKRMMDALRHRGPDQEGLWDSPEISMGARRLSIVDLESGEQPVFNEDRSVCAILNGEIYNHPELRNELEAAGHKFRSRHSDTEVLVHLYEEFGDNFLHKLNGMFAIAIWDSRKRRLLLARDRAGIKPLYLRFKHGLLAFASEIKSLLARGDITREPDYRSLYHYFSFKNIPAPGSAFDDIEQLRPGELAVLEDGRLTKSIWWNLRFSEDATIDEHEAATQLAGLIEDSVRLCLRADVPFGAFLSGGLDSSSVVAIMSKLGCRHLKTFSLVYKDDFPHKASDQKYARAVSDLFGTEHHEYALGSEEVIGSLEAVIDAFDEPFSGVTSTYFLTRLISQHVKVALSGDGADELFGSYLPHRLAQPLHTMEQILASGGTPARIDPDGLAPFTDRRDYLSGLLATGDESTRRLGLYLWDDLEKRQLLSPKMLSLAENANTGEMVRQIYGDSGTVDPLNRALYCDFKTMLPDQVLAFVDRLSMAHSVEVRPPFLDHRIIEYSARIPGSLKIKSGTTKHILKQSVRGLIPDNIIDRPKEGFVLPVDFWLLKKLRPLVEDSLSAARMAAHGLINHSRVAALLEEHFSGKRNNGPRIWNLLMFQLWWERHVSDGR